MTAPRLDSKGNPYYYRAVGKEAVPDEHIELIKTAVIDRINISNYSQLDKYDRAKLLHSSRIVLGLSEREFSRKLVNKKGRPLPKSTYHDWELPLKAGSKEDFEKAIRNEGERNLYMRLRNKNTVKITASSPVLDQFLRDTIIKVRLFAKDSDLTASQDTESLVKDLKDSLNRLLMSVDKSLKRSKFNETKSINTHEVTD